MLHNLVSDTEVFRGFDTEVFGWCLGRIEKWMDENFTLAYRLI